MAGQPAYAREPVRNVADRNAASDASTTTPADTGATLGGQMGRIVLSALVLAATASAASAQTPPAQQAADQPQLRFHPVTRGTDAVGVIHA